MKIFHIADTHLGFSAYNKLDPESSLNQREVDLYNAFTQFIDIAIEQKPDLILHSGDFFDSVRPTNRAISIAMDQLLRLSKAAIPIVIIAGNHSTPRLRETGSVFRLFEHLENVYPVYKNKYECLAFPHLNLDVHAVPHCTNAENLQNALESLKPNTSVKYNIAMLHAAVVGVNIFKSSEFNEQEVKSGYLKTGFNYIALGHYHEFVKVEENAYYSGSIERLNFLEAVHKDKGYVELEFGNDSESGPEDHEIFYPQPVFRGLPTRPMIDLPAIDCISIDRYEISNEILDRLNSVDPVNKIIRLKVLNLPVDIYKTLDFNQFRKLTSEALHFEIKYQVTKDSESVQAPSIKFELLGTEFKGFMENEAVEDLDKDRLYKLGLEFLIGEKEGMN